jgi:hypothetical protein
MHTMHCGSTATADAFVPVARSGRRELLDAGDNAAFAWSFDTKTYPKAAFTIRFADDQKLGIRLHDLRHSMATIMKVSGVAAAASFSRSGERMLPAVQRAALRQARSHDHPGTVRDLGRHHPVASSRTMMQPVRLQRMRA